MKTNLEIFKLTLKKNEPWTDEITLNELSNDFLNQTLKTINEFDNNIIKNHENLEYFMNVLRKKETQTQMSHSYFSSFIKIYGLTLKLLIKLPENEQKKIYKKYYEKISSFKENSEQLKKYLIEALYYNKLSQKQSGRTVKELEPIFKRKNYIRIFNIEDLKELTFILNDTKIKEYICKNDIKYIQNNQKKPDFLFMNKNRKIFIGESKYLKEEGGTQNNQVKELEEVSRLENKDISFVSMITGPLINFADFHEIINVDEKPKWMYFLKKIYHNLEKNEKNYFVNLKTFEEIL